MLTVGKFGALGFSRVRNLPRSGFFSRFSSAV
jgi:hypothetical protein